MKKPLAVVSYVALVSVLFLGGFVSKDLRQGRPPAFVDVAPKAGVQTPTQVFTSEYARILNDYDKPVDEDSLLYAGMEGMLNSLGDPHTQFLEPVVADEFEESSMGRQSFGGVGARLMPDPMGVKVIQVFKESPAARGGVRNGDIIVNVNGEDVGGQDSDEIVEKIKGKIGTPVTLTVYRGGNNRVKLTMRRAQIIPPSADSNILEGTNVGYVLVTGFEAPTPSQFAQSMVEMERQGAEGIVIDLRNNPGGLLEAAQQMLNLFADHKTVVTMHTRNGHEETVKTDRGRTRETLVPVTILINEQSASAAEIFAGVMRDYGKATLVGEHSYGKASVQNVIRVAGGGSVKITIAHYKLPSGEDISRKVDVDGRYVSGGIKPDVPVELNWGPRVAMGDPKSDNVLRRAIEILKSKNPRVKF